MERMRQIEQEKSSDKSIPRWCREIYRKKVSERKRECVCQ